LGNRNVLTSDFNGQISHAFLAKRVLTAEEAAAWIAAPNSLFVDNADRKPALPYPSINTELAWTSNLVMLTDMSRAGAQVLNMADVTKPGTMTGATWATDETQGNVVVFDGTDDEVDFGTDFDVTAYDTWSVGLIVRFDATGTEEEVFGQNQNTNRSWSIIKTAADQFNAKLWNDANSNWLSITNTTTTVVADTWYTVAIVVDETAETLSLYVDEDAAVSDTPGSGTRSSGFAGNLKLGENGDNLKDHAGQVAIAWLADTALTAAEAAAWIADPRSVYLDSRKDMTAPMALLSSHALVDNVTRLWTLNEGAGNPVSVQGHEGVLDTDAGWATIGGEHCIDFVLTTASMDIGSAPFPVAASAFIARVWLDGLTGGQRIYDDGQQLIWIDGSGFLTIRLGASGSAVSTTVFTTGQWYTIVGTWDATGNVNAWIDGFHDVVDSNQPTPVQAGGNAFLGNTNTAGTNSLEGYMSFFAALDVELSDAQGKSLSLNPWQLVRDTEQGFLHGSTLDPQPTAAQVWTSAATDDYEPAVGSVLIDAGVAVNGRTTDWTGITSIPTGVAPDIGALEVSAPMANITPDPMAFGNVVASKVLVLAVQNTGSADLVVTNITSDDAQFVPGSTSFTVTPGNTTNVNITYTPAGLGAHSGVLTVTSDAASSPDTIDMTGTGVAPSGAATSHYYLGLGIEI
jgi:hypothetical protein